jgi:hypothetical protein
MRAQSRSARLNKGIQRIGTPVCRTTFEPCQGHQMGINTRRGPTTPAKRVWRISASNPNGEWVDISPARKVQPAPVKSRPTSALSADEEGHWLMSSFDLLHGTDVTEDPATVPDDLFDKLFPPRQDDAKSPPR